MLLYLPLHIFIITIYFPFRNLNQRQFPILYIPYWRLCSSVHAAVAGVTRSDRDFVVLESISTSVVRRSSRTYQPKLLRTTTPIPVHACSCSEVI